MLKTTANNSNLSWPIQYPPSPNLCASAVGVRSFYLGLYWLFRVELTLLPDLINCFVQIQDLYLLDPDLLLYDLDGLTWYLVLADGARLLLPSQVLTAREREVRFLPGFLAVEVTTSGVRVR